MSNLFKKAAVFTDIHFGLKSNSLQHNQDCANFVDWFITKAKNESGTDPYLRFNYTCLLPIRGGIRRHRRFRRNRI